MKNVFISDFGPIELSAKTMEYLGFIDPDWLALINSKPRGKKKQEAKRRIDEVMTAIRVCASIEWQSGGVLETF